ncbi:TLD-domain-containing protein [Coniophora puteana RWD-64-598 SS2]|uniref:Oxidation resistance protein 1 n=1 Tax=Coniophora puteana (strain RWD-64-598) TaxID=741705 RepID=A0A5M3M7H6_CONPW|nr:TLD-domain-containing protein [Coniophora puteana RWD-64-598 SS2]EIW75007.1 TLD-domain-containing protein [Coniophora puteana RWD-64-598 SS2]
MPSALSSIPSLIPLPASNDQDEQSSYHVPLPRPSSSQTKVSTPPNALDSNNIDRFASLFSPGPSHKASTQPTPSGGPLFSPAGPTSPSRPTHHRSFSSSIGSDFGAFVSVPATDDPLSAFLPITPGFGAPQAVKPDKQAADLAELNGHARNDSNTTLDFFDDFTSRAKDNAERNRRGVLDELLQHEDRPMYWAHPPPPSPPPSPTPSYLQAHPELPATGQKYQDDDMPHPRPRPPSPTMSRVHPQSPVAPQLTGRSTPPSASSSSLSQSRSSLSKSPPPMVGSPPFKSFSQPPSAQSTLSRISSGWVPSFLSSSGSRTRTSEHNTPSSASASAILGSAVSGLPESSITHGTPFGTAVFVPPSGAPGFTGDRNWDKRGFAASYENDEQEKERRGERSVKLVGRKEGTASVLTVELADQIRSHMPALTRLPRSWTLLYSVDQHGISLNTLYSRCEPKPPNTPGATKGALVIVKDANDGLFGAWIDDGLRMSKGYYGSGESFLWGLDKDRGLTVHKWTGRNDYVALCEPDSISFGGGDGHYGLYIDSSLLEGSTAPCPTFGNEALCMRGSRRGVSVAYDVVGLEVWGVGPS